MHIKKMLCVIKDVHVIRREGCSHRNNDDAIMIIMVMINKTQASNDDDEEVNFKSP